MEDDKKQDKKIINPFNKDRSKKVQESSNTTAASEDYQVIPIRKPNGDGFIKIKGKTLDDCMWIDIAYIKEDPLLNSETPYALMADGKELEKLKQIFDWCYRPAIATICMDEQGEVFVWVLKQPREGMKEMPYHTTGIKAIQSALKGWKKVYTKSMHWHTRNPFDETIFEKYEWPKFTDEEIYKFAFEDKIIDNLNHEQVRVARGQKNES